jgi:hypothetical protein
MTMVIRATAESASGNSRPGNDCQVNRHQIHPSHDKVSRFVMRDWLAVGQYADRFRYRPTIGRQKIFRTWLPPQGTKFNHLRYRRLAGRRLPMDIGLLAVIIAFVLVMAVAGIVAQHEENHFRG